MPLQESKKVREELSVFNEKISYMKSCKKEVQSFYQDLSLNNKHALLQDERDNKNKRR